MKYLEQVISQAVRFCGRLEYFFPSNIFCPTNIFFPSSYLCGLGHVTCPVEQIDRRNVISLKYLYDWACPVPTSVFAMRRVYPSKPTGPKRIRKTRNRFESNPWLRINHSLRSTEVQPNHMRKSEKSKLDLHATSFRVVSYTASLWLIVD